MNKQLDILKLQLEDFFERSKSETVSVTERNTRSSYDINKSIYELEMHILKLKKQYRVNRSLNSSIESPEISKSFNQNQVEFFRSHDYLLSFLVYLCQSSEDDAEQLRNILFKYTESISSRLTYKDLIVTATGATRCFTNQRFALKELRELGLVFKKDKENNKRTILPTPVGMLIVAYHLKDLNESAGNFLNEMRNGAAYFDNSLYNTLDKLKRNPESFLKNVQNKFPCTNFEINIEEILSDYSEYILKYITVIDTGLKIEEGFEEASQKYYDVLKQNYDLSYKLKLDLWQG
ncbi:hypothetical protein RCC89_14560 [Cytophagaceae bacterium ABcell3]|nr:hypothetical protein RCC89_14560 [Cytophagaceae bacterium ABcell3]